MNTDRHKSKSKRVYKYGSESREQRTARIHATKSNSKRRKLEAKYKKAKVTKQSKAFEIEKTKETARKVFEVWLNSEKVNGFLDYSCYWFMYYLK